MQPNPTATQIKDKSIAAMASDPEIQHELQEINAEFSVADSDGLDICATFNSSPFRITTWGYICEPSAVIRPVLASSRVVENNQR